MNLSRQLRNLERGLDHNLQRLPEGVRATLWPSTYTLDSRVWSLQIQRLPLTMAEKSRIQNVSNRNSNKSLLNDRNLEKSDFGRETWEAKVA